VSSGHACHDSAAIAEDSPYPCGHRARTFSKLAQMFTADVPRHGTQPDRRQPPSLGPSPPAPQKRPLMGSEIDSFNCKQWCLTASGRVPALMGGDTTESPSAADLMMSGSATHPAVQSLPACSVYAGIGKWQGTGHRAEFVGLARLAPAPASVSSALSEPRSPHPGKGCCHRTTKRTGTSTDWPPSRLTVTMSALLVLGPLRGTSMNVP
jgi:hypothetical protein